MIADLSTLGLINECVKYLIVLQLVPSIFIMYLDHFCVQLAIFDAIYTYVDTIGKDNTMCS